MPESGENEQPKEARQVSKENQVDPRFQAIFEVSWKLLVLCPGSFIVAIMVPWSGILDSQIPTGGDNPAHLVLVKSLAEALFEHGDIIHYSYDFWSGFELFQTYFYFPYMLGAVLTRVFDPNVAYKLWTIAALLLFPFTFAWAFSILRCHPLIQASSSVLALGCLFTDAHTMWGGNAFSLLSGMSANAWAFVFLPLAFAYLLRAFKGSQFSLPAVITVFCCMSCHFYALVMIFVLFISFAFQDFYYLCRGTRTLRSVLPFYLNGLVSVMLLAWWIIPLISYKPFAAEYGYSWDFPLLETFRFAELLSLAVAFCILPIVLFKVPSSRKDVTALGVFLGIYVWLFYYSEVLGSTAFNNVRLWPSIFFSCYFLLVLSLDGLFRISKRVTFIFLTLGLFFGLPTNRVFVRVENVLRWNYAQISERKGWEELEKIVQLLNTYPRSRVSFEVTVKNDYRLGSGRTFEMLPYLTHHDIVEGGIVGSASYPGVAYALQCLSSEVCAGWPSGSFMPNQDTERAVAFMKTLGVRYHVASTKKNREELLKLDGVRPLYEGEMYSLFEVAEGGQEVEVYDGAIPVIRQQWPHTLLLNQYRWDNLRDSLFVFDESRETLKSEQFRMVEPRSFINYLIKEWKSPNRVNDRNMELRRNDPQFLKLYVFAWGHEFDLSYDLENMPELAIHDGSFSSINVVSNQHELYSEVAVPLVRDSVGKAKLSFIGDGYEAFIEGKKIEWGKPIEVHFKEKMIQGYSAPFVLVVFKPVKPEFFRSIDAVSYDKQVREGFPGPSSFSPPEKISSNCQATLERGYHRLKLQTQCPGKAHLIKYSYFPKWLSSVPVYRGSYGYMVVFPEGKELILEHRPTKVDSFASYLSLLTLISLIFWISWTELFLPLKAFLKKSS